MSVDAGSDSTAPNLNLTPEEKRLYGDLFKQADPENLQVVTGDAALTFFDKTRLDSRVLGEIWQIADKENRGFLTPAGFGLVLRLIGHAQAGREPRPELALQHGPLPRFDGLHVSPSPASPTPRPQPAIQPPPAPGPGRIPPLTPDKVANYSALFDRQPLQGNMLSGDQARQIFDQSGLPNETLGRIWALADTDQRGALALPQFVIAMHLLASLKSGLLRVLPATLPPGLYEAAARRASLSATRHSLDASAAAAMPSISHQMTGPPRPPPASPLNRSSAHASDWAVSASDKDRFDQLFATIDKTNKGFITGDEAVPFFSQSGLPEEALAQIWDLADFDSQGRLTADGFAVAMYLIRQQRTSSRSIPLPATLPPSLVPPKVRNQISSLTSASPFDSQSAAPTAPSLPKSALDDLFGLDPSAPPQASMSTGGSNPGDPFAGPSRALSPPVPPKASPTPATFRPFVPSSSFGRGLTTHSSGDAPARAPRPSITDDLLDDDDPEASKKITGETTELANLSNQISTLSRQMQDVQSKRTATQNELNQATSQKQNFEQRLSQLRSLYEKEADDTRILEEQLAKSRTEGRSLQGECMTLEGTYGDLQAQHQQVEAALQADRQENANLKERIRFLSTEIAQLKPQLEKVRSEARQQKGLVAINKKQLAASEAELGKLKSELEESTKAGLQESSQAGDSAISPTSGPARRSASPALSAASGNNPFFKRAASTDRLAAFPRPVARSMSDHSFDDVFGPSPTPRPDVATIPASVGQQDTGASATSARSSFTTTSGPIANLARSAAIADEAPAPPESRQMSSSFLPLPGHSESLSSSRQVSPPASHVGESATGSALAADEPAPIGDVDALSAGEAASKSDQLAAATTPIPGSARGSESSGSAPKPWGTGVGDESVLAAKEATPPFSESNEAKARADFENAFATMTTSIKKPGSSASADVAKTRSAFDSEFPPISELERDDDDDSDSDKEGAGFDDDFAPASPPNRRGGLERPLAGLDEGVERTGPGAATAVAPQVPAKDPIVGLPTAVGESAAQGAAMAPTTTAKGGFDDLDDDFDGLEDAKEGSADDDFASISRDDFNPVFGSSPSVSQTKSEATASGQESGFDIVASASAPATTQAQAQAAASGAGGLAQQKAAESHDWDAIFAGLDSSDLPVPAPPPAKAAEPEAVDDPILSKLTGMGYPRAAALAALEKYNYNLEKAANYLASQS